LIEQQLREEVKEAGENCKIRSIVSYTIVRYGLGDSVKYNEICATCGMEEIAYTYKILLGKCYWKTMLESRGW
jgi:hypothetical protein